MALSEKLLKSGIWDSETVNKLVKYQDDINTIINRFGVNSAREFMFALREYDWNYNHCINVSWFDDNPQVYFHFTPDVLEEDLPNVWNNYDLSLGLFLIDEDNADDEFHKILPLPDLDEKVLRVSLSDEGLLLTDLKSGLMCDKNGIVWQSIDPFKIVSHPTWEHLLTCAGATFRALGYRYYDSELMRKMMRGIK